MTRIVSFTAALLAGAVVVGAQQTPPSTPPATPSAPQQPSASQSKPAADNKVIVTGCLRQGASASSYILADAAPASGGGSGAVGTAGSSSSARKTYALTGKSGDDLKQHLNHRVEITGVASARPASSSGSSMPSGAGAPSGSGQAGAAGGQSGAAGGQSGAAGASASSSSQPSDNLEVQSFKMVAASCS